jgi:hypothetical protein
VDSPTSVAEESVPPVPPPSRLFELRSVVVHIGRESTRGHYVTIVRSGDRCVLLDDDIVRVVEQEVLRSFYGTAGTSSSSGNQASTSGQAPSSAGWGGGSEGGGGDSGNRMGSADRYPSHSPPMPLYERSPEGTCCGYLLFYEAVDGANEHEGGSVIDVGAAADWISEDRNLTDSESGDSTEENPGSVQERPPVATCDDSELTQAFEQRCIPRGPSTRNQQYVASSPNPGVSSGVGTSGVQDRNRDRGHDRSALNSGAAGHGGAFAWTAADEEGGRAPASSGNHGPHGVRTLGSVVPAAGTAPEAVSPSRVNVTTMPSPSGSDVAG